MTKKRKPYVSRIGVIIDGELNFLKYSVGFPFAKLTLTENTITVQYPFFQSIVFTRDNVKELKIDGWLSTTGIRIIHSKEHVPDFVLLATFYLGRLIKKLEDYGWGPVEQPPARVTFV